MLSYIVIYEGERGCGGEREFFDRTVYDMITVMRLYVLRLQERY